jgi:hypothetical protein
MGTRTVSCCVARDFSKPLRSGEAAASHFEKMPLKACSCRGVVQVARVLDLMPLLGRKIDHTVTVTPRRVGIEYGGGGASQRRQQQKQSQKVGDKARN